MERNWLIRTSQNQILGPVAKQKLLEFIQKGALGLTDEVASGNGYWFSLKEKDLVEKYIYGDIPQGYNPISESKSVLSRREHPERTTSINTAPVNQTQHTQVIKVSDILGTPENSSKPAASAAAGIAPNASDLEFPDMTVVTKIPTPSPVPTLNLNEESDQKIPDASDLEFPDVAAITSSVNANFKIEAPAMASAPQSQAQPTAQGPKIDFKTAEPKFNKEPVSSDEAHFPSDDDLAFPDMGIPATAASVVIDDKTSTKVEKGKVDLSHQYTRTVALDNEQVSVALPEVSDQPKEKKSAAKSMRELEGVSDDIAFSLTLDVPKAPAPEADHHHHEVKNVVAKKEKLQIEDRKLLHDRKPKASAKAAQRDPNREVAHRDRDTHSEPLKKRNDNYIFFILIILVLIIVAVFFYFKEILNKPLPV
ncbi:hypothetical protein DOM21_04295 [Bacteriovorax stolpii]|uniref:Uncharacterized protein n=1 Tax=Bacteriovorax stolpii TaxID=960 RepID=A0A2K9NX40_BACTC|nr:hypothetical protein [Bacteriovorax stolpii]AUN99334.1 hypothetical protein C0V70_14710 [Bacteriovorax stolpii]QDK40686.1 hypothetical protein DOM21_04295 [Bacteriovorax stolpii]TDP55126.1 hypothetical protein C8D79_0169 [Bacteriovorax stolpii]